MSENVDASTGPAVVSDIDDIDWDGWTPVDRATLLFVVAKNRILLIRKKRGLGAGKLNGPGGRLEANETWEAAARREVREELCVEVGPTLDHGQLCFQFVDGYSIQVRVFSSPEVIGVPEETDEARPHWFRVDDIPYEQMWADDRLWLPLLLEGRRFSGCFVFDGDRMLDHRLELRGHAAG